MNHSIETVRRFLDCLYDNQPICVSKLSLRCSMTNQTAMILKDKLTVTEYIRQSTPDARSVNLHITEKGKELLRILKELEKA